jgi:hypothetical protein
MAVSTSEIHFPNNTVVKLAGITALNALIQKVEELETTAVIKSH